MSFESKKFTALIFLTARTIFKLDISRQQQKKESTGKDTLEQNKFYLFLAFFINSSSSRS